MRDCYRGRIYFCPLFMLFLTLAQKTQCFYMAIYQGFIIFQLGRGNSIQYIFKKKCYAYLVIGSLGNSQLYTRVA